MNIEFVEETLSLIDCRSSFFYHLFYNYLVDHPEMGILLRDRSVKRKLKRTINCLFLIIGNFRNSWLCKTIAIQIIEEKDMIADFILQHELLIGESFSKTLGYFLKKRWTPEVKQAWMDVYHATLDMIVEEQQRYKHSLWNFSNQTCFEKLRVKAVAKKALRDGCPQISLIYKLLEDDYFQKIEKKMGKARTLKIISDLVKNANGTEKFIQEV